MYILFEEHQYESSKVENILEGHLCFAGCRQESERTVCGLFLQSAVERLCLYFT